MKGKLGFSLPLLLTIAILFLALIATSIGVFLIPVDVVLEAIGFKLGILKETDIPNSILLTITELRIPRIIASLLVGSALAICGTVFQSIFRNPICDPYMLGISSGASLGAAVAFTLGWQTSVFGVTLPALITALITLAVILSVSQAGKQKNSEKILLTGIAINFLISAVITLLMVINQQEMQKIVFWTMGSLASITWRNIAFMLPMVCLTILPLFYYAKDLNIMQMGSDTAKSLGVNTGKVTLIVLIFSSLLIASIVSVCGVIGFIGLIVPHIARFIFGNNNRLLFLYSIFFGAFFMLLADTFARTLAIPSELPVGSITALAGAPYFIYLLLRK
ncbi:MAG: iron ABC transporter permease [Bacteroidales bacterium]|jgi:iron complex transport system permease protein|nr:iron ABC transporter permease [Bacteroidales bacterium]